MLAALALKQWGTVSPTKPLATGAAWIEYMARAITVARAWSTDLTIAFYQLSRALDTGFSLGPPLTGGLELDALRDTFNSMVEFVAELEDSHGIYGGSEEAEWLMAELGRMSKAERHLIPDSSGLNDLLALAINANSGNGPVDFDDFQWPADMTMEDVMNSFGPMLREKALDLQQKRYVMTLSDMQADLMEEFRKSGSSGAGVVDFAVMSGGRNATERAMRSDRRIKLVARRTSHNPCAFCAMLASRGWVYVNVNQAGVKQDDGSADIIRYHFNCKCTADVRWVSVAEASKLNKHLSEVWRQVTDDTPNGGYTKSGGSYKLNTFRRWMRKNHPNGFTQFTSQEDK